MHPEGKVICSDSKNGDALSLYIKDAKARKQIINGCHIGLARNHEGRDRTLVFLARIIKGCENLGKLFILSFLLLSASRAFSV